MENKSSSKSLIIKLVLFIALSLAAIYVKNTYFPTQSTRPANSIMVLQPYKYASTWVFDDKTTGLVREAFVSGTPEIIDQLVKDIPNADEGFRLTFSAQPFPDNTISLTWLRGDESGNWYHCEEYDLDGWLCPGLFKYYEQAPKTLYAKADPIDP